MSARLQFANVGRRFQAGHTATVALEAINLDVNPGSFAALVGPSGCGKSTLLHIAAGLDTGFTGAFRREPAGARLACLFQQPRLLPWRTVSDNIRFILEPLSTAPAQIEETVARVLAMVDLVEAADQFPSRLSGGMQQRAALARALAVDPDVLLMDEPFSALDELTATAMRQEVARLFAQKSRTVVLVTHNIIEACFLADRIVVMSRRPGRIVADMPVNVATPRRLSDPALTALADRVLGLIEHPYLTRESVLT
jgi:ABC-type nitrate/sulfonate/bicarbonate transport system ATPase subunit